MHLGFNKLIVSFVKLDSLADLRLYTFRYGGPLNVKVYGVPLQIYSFTLLDMVVS